jgi:hypothetical protein
MFKESTVRFRALESLTEDEKAAAAAYQGDSTFFHACAQRRERDLTGLDAYNEFMKTCEAHHRDLVRAIAKYEVSEKESVYSGQANGTAVVGSIRGDYKKLIGLDYCYPGFISTSGTVEGADGFLDRNQGIAVRPVMLAIELDIGMKALPLNEATNRVEVGEVLIGRHELLSISDAEVKSDMRFKEGVLWFFLSRKP